MRRGLCGSVSPSGRFPDFCAVARPPAGECSEFSHALLSFMPAGPQADLPPDAHSFGGKRSVRALIAAARSGSFGEGGLGDGESLLSSPLLLSAGVFLCPRTALPGRSVTGKLTGRPYGEAPLGRSRLLS